MPGQLIAAWSFSTWKSFQKCKHTVYLDKVAKAPKKPIESTEDREHPLLRGNRVHDAAEAYVTEEVELIPELRKFAEELEHLGILYDEGMVEVEQPWAFTSDWKTTNWSSADAWVRAKLDAFVRYLNNTHAVIVDYKTGKLWGNEVSHNLQGQIYAIMAFIKYPDLEYVTVEFWYTDQNEITTKHYTRDQALKFLKTWTQRGNAVTSEIKFLANPSNIACKWCSFGKNVGTGICEFEQ
jgi:hypothetical protein